MTISKTLSTPRLSPEALRLEAARHIQMYDMALTLGLTTAGPGLYGLSLVAAGLSILATRHPERKASVQRFVDALFKGLWP